MNFTFGIITDGLNPDRVLEQIQSIQAEKIPEYEIIIIGGEELNVNNVYHIPFCETTKISWITRKKNFITHFADYDNVVYMHDYIGLVPGWYEGFLKFGDDWDVCMNKILTKDGHRFRDWMIWDDPRYGHEWIQTEPWCPPEGLQVAGTIHYAPYSYAETQHMYISGAYWVAKRKVMLSEPLNESLMWGQAEDVEWSRRIRDKYRYVMNTHSTVQLIKDKQ